MRLTTCLCWMLFLWSLVVLPPPVSTDCPPTISEKDVERLNSQLGLSTEFDPAAYMQHAVTVLCYTNSSSSQFLKESTIRVSILYDQDTDRNSSFIASFYCLNNFEWRYNSSYPNIIGPRDNFITTFNQRSDCLHCFDNSGIADPSWCSCKLTNSFVHEMNELTL